MYDEPTCLVGKKFSVRPRSTNGPTHWWPVVDLSHFVNHVNHKHRNTIAATQRTESKNYAVPFLTQPVLFHCHLRTKKYKQELSFENEKVQARKE